MLTTAAIPDPVSRAIALAEYFRVLAKQRREVDLESAKTLAELDELQQWHVVGSSSAAQSY